MEIEWADSTEKHGVPRGDAIYAMTHAIVVSDKVTVEPGQTKNPRKVYIGPAHTRRLGGCSRSWSSSTPTASSGFTTL